jgi:PAS domain-containing protein
MGFFASPYQAGSAVMMVWRGFASDVLSSLAYASVAVALWRLFRQQHAAIFGASRWPVLGFLAAESLLQAALALCGLMGWQAASGTLALLASLCQLAIGASLWPFLWNLHPQLKRAVGQRAQAFVRRAEQEVAEAISWLEQAEPAAHFGHWRINLADKTLEWSEEMYRIHGVSPAAFAPTLESSMALFHPEDRRTVSGSIAVAMAEGGSFEIAVRLRRPDGELRHTVLRGQAQPPERGEEFFREPGQASVVGVLVDVTEQKAAEARPREANNVALQANAR